MICYEGQKIRYKLSVWLELTVLPGIIFIDVILFQSKSKHLCGIHESDSKTVNTKELTLCVLWERWKENGEWAGTL